DPESVVAGEPVDVELSLFSEQRLTIREAALLLYSSMGARVAVVDLRAAGLSNFSLDGALTIRVSIKALPLVEGLYSWGLWISSDEVGRDVHGITQLAVLPRQSEHEVGPFSAVHRGFVELEWKRA